MAKTQSIEIQLGKILDDYSSEMKELVFASAKKAALETKRMLKNTSPRKTGEYAKGWAIKKGKSSYIVYNKTPSLTHLLENSHVIRNKYGSYGRTGPGHGQVVHIKPAEEFGSQRFLEIVMEEASKL